MSASRGERQGAQPEQTHGCSRVYDGCWWEAVDVPKVNDDGGLQISYLLVAVNLSAAAASALRPRTNHSV